MKSFLAQLVAGQPLSGEQAVQVFELVMTGKATECIGALLALIQARGPTEDELTGAARVMRAHATKVQAPPGLILIDTCGTGGTGAQTRVFNISTAAGLVAGAARGPRGIAVAKHGNRAATGVSGSSQVLEALGIRPDLPPEVLTRCLDETGFCFCFAPAHHPAMRFAAPVRAALGFRTIFNLLGPLTNPAGAQRQLVGVPDPGLTEPIARVLGRLGAVEAMVVHGRSSWTGSPGSPRTPGTGGLCDLTTTGPTRLTWLRQGRIESEEFDSRSLGLAPVEVSALAIDSPADSAALIRGVLAGEKGPARDMVCLNAAGALMVAGVAEDWRAGLALASEAIDSGAAARVVERLAQLSRAG